MKKAILFVILITISSTMHSQHFEKLGRGLSTKTFFHQQGIPYYLHEMDSSGRVYAVYYDTVTSSFNFGHEYSQVRLQIYDGISWLFSRPIRLYNRYSVDAPRVLDLCIHGNDIYLGGSFDSSENNLGAGLVRFSNSGWQSSGVSLLQSSQGYFEVNKCYSFGNQLLVSGNFDSIPGTRVNGLVLKSGAVWTPVGQAGNYGFNGLSGTSNVFFQVINDSLYAFNKNKITPDSMEIGGTVTRRLAVWRNGQFVQLNTPARYIAALTSVNRRLVVIPSSFLVYTHSIQVHDNGNWKTYNLPDSFYATNYTGSLDMGNRMYLAFQDGNAREMNIYEFDGNSITRKTSFKMADNFIPLECSSMKDAMSLAGNFRFIKKGQYQDSFRAITKILFRPATVISGSCFLDLNNDQVRQAAEPLMDKCRILSDDNIYMSVSDGSGRINLKLPVGGTYSLQGQHELGYECSKVFHLDQTKDSIYYMDFPFLPAGNNDVSVKLFCHTANKAKQGFETTYTVFLENYSTQGRSVDITVNFDKRCSNFTYKNFIPHSKAAGQLVIRTFIDTRTRESFSFSCIYAVDSFSLGEQVKTNAFIQIDDAVKMNNRDTLRQTVSAAFDPNIKVAFPDVIVNNEREIKYTIFFQNLGNDVAKNVTVVDSFGSLVSIGSVTYLNTGPMNSKPIIGNAVLTWVFEDINLPPARLDSAKSIGFVNLKVRLYKNARIGDTIFNKAYIYFDYQKPVITNNAKVVFARNNAVPAITEQRGFAVYPNPGNGVFHYENQGMPGGDIQVFSAEGKLVYTTALQSEGELRLPPDLARGIYLLKINGYTMETCKIILVD